MVWLWNWSNAIYVLESRSLVVVDTKYNLYLKLY